MKATKTLCLLIGGLMALWLESGCTKLNSQPQTSWEIAALLDRPTQLGSAEEQERVKEQYHRLRQRILQQPDKWDAYLKMAQLFIIEARVTGEHGYYYPAALHLLERTEQYAHDEEDQFQTAFLKASVLLSLHQFQEALSFGKKAVALRPRHALTYATLVDANVELGKYADAIQLADKMVSLRPDLRSYARISYLRELTGDVPGAIQAMEMAIEAGYPGQEDRAWCRTTLGGLLSDYGQLQQADAQYRYALAERPNYPFALAGLAELHHLQGSQVEALALLDSACALIPEVGFFQQKASIYQILADTIQVQELTAEIMEMLKDDEQHGHNMESELAQVYLNLVGDFSKAQTLLEKAYQDRPHNQEVNFLLGELHTRKGDWHRAISYAEKSVARGNQNPKYLGLLGYLYAKMGEEEKARSCIRISLNTHPFQQYFFSKENKDYVCAGTGGTCNAKNKNAKREGF